MPEKSEPKIDVETSGGGYIKGNVDTGGGDFVGRDKIIYQAADRPPLYVNVPSMPNYFVGREELIENVVSQLLSGQQLALSAEGLPGAGKTTMAVALAHHQEVLEHFKDGVLWAGLGPTPNVMSQLARWAGSLKLDVSELVSEKERSTAVKDTIGKRSMLLIIDDAWDLDVANLLRCGGPHCCHILTTRNQTIARQFAGASHVVNTPILEKEDAYQLLGEIAPEACAADSERAKFLVEVVGRLPLAIELLGGYLSQSQHRRTTRRRQQALDALTDPAQRLHLASQRLGAQRNDSVVTLQATIALSLEGLPETTVAAFHALGAFAPKPERFELDAAIAVTRAEEDVLFDLVDRNLLEMEEDGSITIHQVVADVARTKMQPEHERSHREYYLAQVNEDRENWQQIERVYGQIKWAQSNASGENLADFVWHLRIYHERRGLWQDKLAWAKQALEQAQEREHLGTIASMLSNIGSVYDDLGNKQQALDYFNQALPRFQQVGDQDGEATTFNNIGLVYYALDDQQQALEHYNQALRLRKQVGDKRGEANSLNNIGLVYAALGEKKQALDYFNQALPLRIHVGDKSGKAITLNNIGGVYAGLGDKKQALDYFNQALPLSKQEGYKRGEANSLFSIGRVYDDLGKKQQALEYLYQALLLYQELGYKRGEANSLHGIGFVYSALDDKQQALDYYNQALPLYRQVSNKGGEATNLTNIGFVYAALGDKQQALKYYNQALPLRKQVDDKSGEAGTLINIGKVYADLGDNQKALAYYNQALPLFQEVDDKNGEAVTLTNTGRVYSILGDKQKALAYYNQALLLFQEVDNKYREATTLTNIGRVYADLGDNQKVLAYYNQALPLFQEVDDKDHEATTLTSIGSVYVDLGDNQKVLAYYNQALPLFQEVDDKNGEATTLTTIGSVYGVLGDKQQAFDIFEQALALNIQVGDRFNEIIIRWWFGVLYRSDDCIAEAIEHLETAVEIASAVQSSHLDPIKKELDQTKALLTDKNK